MPSFKWHAATETGEVVRGTSFARSPAALESSLRRQGVGVLVAYQRHKVGSCSYHELTALFEQISALLTSGIRLVDALQVVEVSGENDHLSGAVRDCWIAVQEGFTLSSACAAYPEFFPPLVIRLLEAGETSGTLAAACAQLSEYYRYCAYLQQKVRSALLLPCITLGCFVLVLIFFVMFVVPRFATLLASMGHAPSGSLQFLLGLLLGSFLGVIYLLRTSYQTGKLVQVLLKIPLLRRWVLESSQATFFKLVSMLVHGKIDLAQAVSLAAELLKVPQYRQIAQLVVGGFTLRAACDKAVLDLDGYSRALLLLGETTGNMATLLSQCATHYQRRFERRLQFISQLVQPLLLLLLGGAIAALMLLIYEPILTLSTTVH